MIKAIDTHYKGYKFRSRLEARVAVFLDTLTASWQYEPEGFSLPINGNYLPDFLITSLPTQSKWGYTGQFWLEVKAQSPTKEEQLKLRELCIETQIPGAFFVGQIHHNNKFSDIVSHNDIYDCYNDVFTHIQVPINTYIENVQTREDSRLFWGMYGKEMTDCIIQFIDMQNGIQFKPAAKAALSARFEFGESG
jgi:hypothetical protein